MTKQIDDVDTCRIAVLGAKDVGKTSLIRRYLYGTFKSNCSKTIEDLHKGEHMVNGINFEMDIIDTCGTDEFPDKRKWAIANSHAFILVYSLEDTCSFQEVLELQECIKKCKGKRYDVPMVIVGNKLDLFGRYGSYERKRSTSIDIFLFKGIVHIEASAKNGQNVSRIFDEILQQIPAKPSPPMHRRRSLPAILPSASSASMLFLDQCKKLCLKVNKRKGGIY